MTTALAPARRRPHPAVRVASTLGGELAWYAGMWALLLVGFEALSLTVVGLRGNVESSSWLGLLHLARYALIGGGLIMVTSHLPTYLAHGISRRDALRGGALAGAGLAIGAAIVATGLLGVERMVFSLADWPHEVGSGAGDHAYTALDQWGLVLLETAGIFLAHLVAGWLVGAGYMRLGWVGGTMLLPLALVPAFGVDVVLGGGGFGPLADWLGIERPSLALGVPLALVLLGAGCALAGALLRRLPLQPGDVVPWR